MVTDLTFIANDAIKKETENDSFASFLKTLDLAIVDTLVNNLNQKIEPLIDCTTCGNCCKTLMINVTETEAENLSTFLNMPLETTTAKYLEKGLGNKYIINQMPCAFLQGTKCSIYNQRFAGCREFPALELKNFTQRLFTIFMHYGRCPIIYNVVEGLKKETEFIEPPPPPEG